MTQTLSEPTPSLDRSILALLRGECPSDDPAEDSIDAALRRYECGGYLFLQWSRNGTALPLARGWARALARAHRKTAVDNLAAVAEFRAVARLLHEAGAPFVLLKGLSYLADLYDDPAARVLTDIDLLIRRDDIPRITRSLRAAGYVGLRAGYEARFRRFEMKRPEEGRCSFEFHWRLGLPGRSRIDQDEAWRRARPWTLEGIACLRLDPEDALIFHVAHLADHYFGPTLKWAFDLREMLRRWQPDAVRLARRSRDCRVRVSLHLALRHLAKLFPDESAPGDLLRRTAPGAARRRLLEGFRSDRPLALLEVPGPRSARRYLLRLLMVDRSLDALALATGGLLRPLTLALSRAAGRESPPWEWPARD